MRMPLTLLFITAIASYAAAQHHGHGAHRPSGVPSATPYAEFTNRSIKALPQQQIDDLTAGRGMGLALAAEMNGYPGPMHVIEHERALGLSRQQKNSMETLMTEMRTVAIKAGKAAIAAERALDLLFADGTAREETLRAAVNAVAQAHGEVRFIHLRTHIQVKAELTPEQIATYDRLRGYVAK